MQLTAVSIFIGIEHIHILIIICVYIDVTFECIVSGIAYGAGVYFAVSPKLSLGYSESNIFMARVLVGESVRGNRDMKMPPLKPGTNRHYDSATDSQSRLFVIFHDTQAYPEYLISF